MAVKIKWNNRAFEQVRRLNSVEVEIGKVVERVRGRLPDEGYESGVERGATRARGYVVTTTYEAIRGNSENHTLLRAIGGAS